MFLAEVWRGLLGERQRFNVFLIFMLLLILGLIFTSSFHTMKYRLSRSNLLYPLSRRTCLMITGGSSSSTNSRSNGDYRYMQSSIVDDIAGKVIL